MSNMMMALRPPFRSRHASTRPVTPPADDRRLQPQRVDSREVAENVARAAQIPPVFRKQYIPDPTLPIQYLLQVELPPRIDLPPNFDPLFSPRGPSERAQDLLKHPVPPPAFVRKVRERLTRAVRDGSRSILSPFEDRRRYPLWSGTFWSEMQRMLEIRDQYDQAKEWLDGNQTPRSTILLPRLYDSWKKFNWSELDANLKADDPTAHLPQPDRLLPILSNQWIEDDSMDLLIRLTSLNMKAQKVAPGLVVPLRFWRELVHLYENRGFFDEMHYPCLTETWAIASGHLDVGFIVNDAKPLPGDQGTHWTACVLNISRGEYHFGDSLDSQPPVALQSALELWLSRNNADVPLRRGKDLDHASQTDGWSCGIIAINTLENYFLGYPLWTADKNADIRITKYINLLEYNRGVPLPPPRSRANSGSTDASGQSRTRTLSTRPDVYFGDIPVEGQDLSVLRGWTPEEGAGISSKYRIAGPLRPDRSRSRSNSRLSTQENAPILANQPRVPPSEISSRPTRDGHVPEPLPGQDMNASPHLSPRPPAIQPSRPIGVPSAPAHSLRPSRDRGRIPTDAVVPASQSEWERESPQEERGRRPKPIMPPPPSGKMEEQRLPWPLPEDQLHTPPDEHSMMPTSWGAASASTSAPIIPSLNGGVGRNSAFPPTGLNTSLSAMPQNGGQPVPFPTLSSSQPQSSALQSQALVRGHQRSKTDPLIDVPDDSRARRNSASSSVSSIWKSVRRSVGNGNRSVGSRSPSTDRSGRSSVALSSNASSVGPRGRTDTMNTSPRRRRKSSLRSVERPPGETRIPGLSVKFQGGHEIEKEPAVHDPSRRHASPVARDERRVNHQAREAIASPPGFSMDDPALPSKWHQKTLEHKYSVGIDQEPTRLVIFGHRDGVSKTTQELYKAFREYQNNNATDYFAVSPRAAHRISLWAISQRLQKETNTKITVDLSGNTIFLTGNRNVLGSARRSILSYARQIDDEKHTHFIVPTSKDLRRVLMISLPRIIGQCGGPEDEDEARQMFTITNPGENGGTEEMIVDLWCHPSMSNALREGLTREVEEFMQNRMREIWAIRIPIWRVHALRNSHIFKKYDEKNPDGVQMTAITGLEKRFGVQVAFPDSKRPAWDQQPVKNTPSPRPGDAEIQFTKLRGSQAQLPLMVAELEDRMKRLLQVTLRVPAQFHRELKSSSVIRRLETLSVDAQISNPVDEHFECLLSAARQEDLDAGQHEISRMAARISKGFPAVDSMPTARRKSSREGNVIINSLDRERELPPTPRDREPPPRERTRSVRVKP